MISDSDYVRLDFWQYFIDNSNDFNNTGNATRNVRYKDIVYTYKKKEFHANYDVSYIEDRKVIQINFQATNDKTDWIANFSFASKYYDSFGYDGDDITLKVHNGWAAMYKSMKKLIRREVLDIMHSKDVIAVEIIGWSLGSGQAMLCAQDLFYNFDIKSYVYTFGSVNPFKVNIFNKNKIMSYLCDCCYECYNFVNKNDIVTYVPFSIWGFKKIRKVLVNCKFKLKNLFKPNIYHTNYDTKEYYTEVK